MAANDASLLAQADWILLAVRPAQLAAASSKLRLRPDQLLISAVAGVTVAERSTAVEGNTPIVRIMPSSYIESLSDGIVPMYPVRDDVEAVLSAAGKIVVFETEVQFEFTMVGACLAGWMYRFMAEQEAWFIGKGLSHTQARLIVAGNIAGASSYAVARSDMELTRIFDGIATRGTFTRAGLDHLLDTRAVKPWLQALDIVKHRLNQHED